MNSFKTLIKMQLKAKMDFGFLKDKRKAIFKIVYLVLGFLAVTTALYFVFDFFVTMHIFSPTLKLPTKLLVLIFTLMQLLSVLTTTFSLMRSLYFSGDNQILLTLPMPQTMVFFSKMTVFYIKELQKNAIFMLPVFISFGLINSYSVWYYPVMLISFLFVSLLPVVLGALLSIPACFATFILRDIKALQVILALIFAAAVAYVFFSVVNALPQNIDIIGQFGYYYENLQRFLNHFSKIFAPFALLVTMITGKSSFSAHQAVTGESLLIFLGLLLVLAVLIVAAFLTARPLYFKMVSRPYKYKRRLKPFKKSNKKLPRIASALKKEFLLIIRSPYAFFQKFISVFILPFAIFLLNKIFAAMNTRLMGDLLALSFNMLIMLLILLNSNIAAASIFSGEGRTVYVIKTKPESLKADLSAKLFIYIFISVLSIFLTSLIIYKVNKISFLAFLFIFLSVLCINVGHIFWNVQSDITNPQYNFYIDGIHTGTNPNETLSTVTAFILSAVFFAITVFLLIENAALAWYKIFAVSLVFFAARTYLLLVNAKVYFRDL